MRLAEGKMIAEAGIVEGTVVSGAGTVEDMMVSDAEATENDVEAVSSSSCAMLVESMVGRVHD